LTLGSVVEQTMTTVILFAERLSSSWVEKDTYIQPSTTNITDPQMRCESQN